MFSGTIFLCCVHAFPLSKKTNPDIYQEQLKLFLHDTRLLLKRGGLFSVVKSWVRARQTAKSAAQTLK